MADSAAAIRLDKMVLLENSVLRGLDTGKLSVGAHGKRPGVLQEG